MALDLAQILTTQGDSLGIPKSITASRFISTLLEQKKLREVEVRREGLRSQGGKKRYVWGVASPYSIGLSLAKNSYLSHGSAVFLHALTDQVPKTLFINKEQTPKPASRTALSQPAIDRAFGNSPRTSKYVFLADSHRYVLLSGKNTGRLEVSRIEGPEGELLDATKLERTLVDIVVRPAYAGGVHEVLRAYRSAIHRLSLNTLVAVLTKLNHVYPYHQSVGFLLQRAGCSEDQLAKVAQLGIKWKFYLDYRIADPAYDDRWQLYYPKGL
jgi:hypothetical protein